MQNKTKRLALMGLLTALGLIIGYIEFLIPIPLGIPGVKPGFANIVIVWALYSLGDREFGGNWYYYFK